MTTQQKSQIYLPVSVNHPILRIGVMLDDLEVPAWVERIIAEIKGSGFADICLVILKVTEHQKQSRAHVGRARRILTGQSNISNALYYRYVEFGNRRHPQFLAPFVTKDLHELLKDTQKLPIKPRRTKFIDRFEENDLQVIQTHNLDVILRFGFKIIKGGILSSARYGVWSYHHDDNKHYRGGPALFWEMYESNPLSGTVLQQLTEELDGGRIIYRSYSATDSEIWLSQNRCRTYWKTSAFIMRCLRKLYLHGEVGLNVEQPSAYDKPIYRTPTNYQMVRFLNKVAITLLKNRIKERFLKEQWFIAYRPAKHSIGLVPDAEGFIPIYPPRIAFMPMRFQSLSEEKILSSLKIWNIKPTGALFHI